MQDRALVTTCTLALVAGFAMIEVWVSGDEDVVDEDLSRRFRLGRIAAAAASDTLCLSMAGTAQNEGLEPVITRLRNLRTTVCSMLHALAVR